MAVIIDTSAIVAIYDVASADHARVMRVLSSLHEPLIAPVAILVEVDYMLQSRLSPGAAITFLASIEAGMFDLQRVRMEDITRCRSLLTQYGDLHLGLADAMIISAAERLNIQTILTLDERHFRVVRPNGFDHFILYPADFSS